MADPKILDYLRKGLKNGYQIDSLKNELIKAGWDYREVNEGVLVVQGKKPAFTPEPTKGKAARELGFGGKVKNSLVNADELFHVAKAETGIGTAFKFQAILALVPTVLFGIMMLLISSFIMMFVPFGDPGFEGASMGLFSALLILAVPVLMVALYVGIIAGTLVMAAIAHVFAHLLGGKHGFGNTYKAFAYGSGPSLLLGWIPLLGIIFLIWTLYNYVKGLSILQDITKRAALVVLVIPIVILILIGMVFWIASATFWPPPGLILN